METADEGMPADRSVFTAALESCRDYDLPHEVLTGDEANERWPGYRLPSSFKVGMSGMSWSGWGPSLECGVAEWVIHLLYGRTCHCAALDGGDPQIKFALPQSHVAVSKRMSATK